MNRVIDNALHGGVVMNALNAKGLYTAAPGGNLGEQRLEGPFSVSQNSRCTRPDNSCSHGAETRR